MSWGISIGPVAYPEIEDALLDATIPESQGPDTPERQEQLQAAKRAALNLLDATEAQVGEKFYISLSGHFSQQDGWTTAWSAGASVNRVQERIEESKPEQPA